VPQSRRPTRANDQSPELVESPALFVDIAAYDVTEQFPALAMAPIAIKPCFQRPFLD
jgi:hypothetical protein